VDNLQEQAGSRNVVHMHGELFKSRCDMCSCRPFDDTNLYEPPAEIPRCECGGRIRPHICWFGEVPFELDRIFHVLERCTIFLARNIGSCGASGELCGACGWSRQNHLCGTRETCERIRVHRMPFGGTPGRCCLICLAHLAHDGYCSFAYSALASFRMGMSGSGVFPERQGIFVGGERPDAGGIGIRTSDVFSNCAGRRRV
jgi:hypothetical protein